MKVVLNPKPVAATVANQASSVGTYEITLTGGSSTNYTISTSNGVLEITKAKLIVTADDKVIECCFTFPSLSSTITGFVNGDTQASLVTGGPRTTTFPETLIGLEFIRSFQRILFYQIHLTMKLSI
ncbi:MAG: MBG domain-containing protein [Cytophagales bacterium]|nr:MBG domain-containing protein [Cytophagales bacterium]